MNEPIDTDKDGNALTLIDVMSTEDNIVDNLDCKIKSEQLRQYITEVLAPREKTIIELRYGLSNLEPLTQREVADQLGISRSYVSRIEKKALEKLHKKFDAHEKRGAGKEKDTVTLSSAQAAAPQKQRADSSCPLRKTGKNFEIKTGGHSLNQ